MMHRAPPILRSWFKGADTVVVMKYLAHEYAKLLDSDLANPDYFKEIHTCLSESNAFMSLIYRSGLFLKGRRLSNVVKHGKAMLHSYSQCATMAHSQGLARFKYNPKYHFLCHLVYDLHSSSMASKPALNPIATSCQMAEDFINKCSTLSRQVSSKSLSVRTLNLYRMAVARAWASQDP